MNKRAQMMPMSGQDPNRFSGVSPFMFLGIFIFILPFLKTIIKINFPSWLTIVGMVFIGIGVVHSALMR